MKKFFLKITLLILIILVSFSTYFYLNGNFRLLAENGLINYLTLSRTVNKEIDSIDEKLRGTTTLSIIIKFKAIEKPKIKNIDSKAKDDFDEFENEFEKIAKENQYWFTQDKINTIITIHNYLETIPQIGNVQSLSTLLNIGEFINNNEKLGEISLSILYNLILSKYEDLILSPYINMEKNEATITMKLIDSEPEKRNKLIIEINNKLKEMIKNKETTYKLTNLIIPNND